MTALGRRTHRLSRTNRKPGHLAAAVVAAWTFGLAEPDVAQALIGGEPSPDADDSVVLIHATVDGTTCTGTMVAPNVLVTALHCVAESGFWDDDAQPVFSCTTAGELYADPFGAGTVGGIFAPETLEIYRGTQVSEFPVTHGRHIVSSGSSTLCTNDIAFLVLEDSLTTPLTPLRVTPKTEPGDLLNLVGYGREAQAPIDWTLRRRTRLDAQPAVDVGPASSDEPLTDARPRTLIINSPSACFGDSGGPALDPETGALVGVFSQLEGQDCLSGENRAHYTHVPEYVSLVEEVEEFIGAPLWKEGEENPYRVEDEPSEPTPMGESGGCAIRPGARGRSFGALVAFLVLGAWRIRSRRCKTSCDPRPG